MYTLHQTIKALRYLCILKVNSSLVRLSDRFSVDLAYVLGRLIADNLSSRLAKPWRKKLDQFSPQKKHTLPENLWPIHVAIIPYPTKLTYGIDEPILFELKLFGEHAEHALFLEMILPAMETAGYQYDPRWARPNCLWGHFDISSIYVCDENHWQVLVDSGKLDLKYNPSPWQWYDETQLQRQDKIKCNQYKHLKWLSAFDLTPAYIDESLNIIKDSGRALSRVMEAMIERINLLLEISKRSELTIWDFLTSAEKGQMQQALEESETIIHGYHDISPTEQGHPGKWKGQQNFPEKIPSVFLPYLNIASILHIGRFTQYGCGTFLLHKPMDV